MLRFNPADSFSFYKEYWLGGLLVLVLLAGVFSALYFSLQEKSDFYADLATAVKNGKLIEGKIVGYEPYRFVTQSKYRIGGDEGVRVEVEYFPPAEERATVREIWDFEPGIEPEEMIGRYVSVYYRSENRRVKAVTKKNREIKIYLKEF